MSIWAFRILPFLSAFLLFSIQPLTGKITLPMIGSSPQGWLVTLAFFQTTLVGGYALVYLSRRLSPRLTGVLFAALLAVGYTLYNRHAQFHMSDDHATALHLFLWLWQSYGFTVMALSAMAPLTQRLFAATYPDNPYHLYAISNAGSFLGLLSYPLFIERMVDLPVQAHGWLISYACMAPLVLLCAYQGKAMRVVEAPAEKTPFRTYGLWLILAALPSSMLSGVTSYITSNIMSLPLLWVIPLALYLATYIAAFSGRTPKYLGNITLAFGIAGALLIALSALGGLHTLPWSSVILITTFTIGAYLCHLRLYNTRPDAGHLPLFYLVISTGGALGGLFNAFLAPMIFPYVHEFFFALTLVFLLVPPFGASSPQLMRAARIAAAACILAAILAPHMAPIQVKALGFVIFLSLALLVVAPRLLILAFAVCLVFNTTRAMTPWPQVSHTRNFFGILHIQDVADGDARVLLHGTILHGMQSLKGTVPQIATYYFGPHNPATQAILTGDNGPVAVVGLGVGQLAAFSTRARPITFYEIDPDVITDAQTYFTYLKDNGVKTIVPGDGRLSLAASTDTYKGIILDAFSGDAIPAHLLTREAIEIYRAHLRPDGYILFHISNQHLHLASILMAQAQNMGWIGLSVKYSPPKDQPLIMHSEWFVMTTNKGIAGSLEKQGWSAPAPASVLWRDDRFSVMDALF